MPSGGRSFWKEWTPRFKLRSPKTLISPRGIPVGRPHDSLRNPTAPTWLAVLRSTRRVAVLDRVESKSQIDYTRSRTAHRYGEIRVFNAAGEAEQAAKAIRRPPNRACDQTAVAAAMIPCSSAREIAGAPARKLRLRAWRSSRASPSTPPCQ